MGQGFGAATSPIGMLWFEYASSSLIRVPANAHLGKEQVMVPTLGFLPPRQSFEPLVSAQPSTGEQTREWKISVSLPFTKSKSNNKLKIQELHKLKEADID